MAPVRRIVLDVLKPHDPELVAFGQRVADLDAVEAVDVTLIEIDREVQNVRLAAEGDDLDYDALQSLIVDLGATVHSVDEVACGDYVVADSGPTNPDQPTWLR